MRAPAADDFQVHLLPGLHGDFLNLPERQRHDRPRPSAELREHDDHAVRHPERTGETTGGLRVPEMGGVRGQLPNPSNVGLRLHQRA